VDDWYLIQGILGEGGWSVVYEAADCITDETVAIKVLQSTSPDLLARFAVEGRVLSALRGPYTPDVHVIGELADGSLYIVMEKVTETLTDRLERGALALDEIFDIGRQLLAACAFIHERGIVHRDIKPSNVGLTRGVGDALSIKLLDFGICLGPFESDGITPHDDAFVGTPEYMAPEQMRVCAMDARTDLYSVGVLLYECITGRVPFQGESSVDVIASVLRDPVLCPAAIRPECSLALDRVVLRALSRAMDDRYQTATEMADALANAKRTLPTPRRASGAVAKTPTTSRRRDESTTLILLIEK
jgi:serine/threonine-protein kinase